MQGFEHAKDPATADLTGRDRLLRLLRAEPIDRVPISPLAYLNNVYQLFDHRPEIDNYWDRNVFDFVPKYVEYCDHFGFDLMHSLCGVWDFYGFNAANDRSVLVSRENWEVAITDKWRNGGKRRTVLIRTPDGDLRHVESYKRSSTYLVVSAPEEYLIKTPRDFEIFRRYSPPGDDMDCSVIAAGRQAVGDKGIVEGGTHGAFNVLAMFRELSELMMDPVTDPGFYREMIEFFLERVIRRVRKMVAHGADLIEVGANLATSAVGPDFFRKHVLEYENRLLKAIHEAGAFNLYHNCGDAAKIMHLYNEMDIDCWGYVVLRPFGDLDLDEVLKVIRPNMVLRGNIDQVKFLRTASPAQVRKQVRELLTRVKDRGNWILATSDFLFDDTPIENIRAFVEAGREFGRY